MEGQEGTSMVNSKKKGYEQMNRDDEEEYSRIPIAGENDSDYDVFEELYDSSYSQGSDEENSDSVNKTATNYVAYAIAPNVPGIVATRTECQPVPLSNRYDNLYLQADIDESALAMEQTSTPPKWTDHVMRFQALQLRMAYKKKTQVRARLMRQIRQQNTYLRMKPRAKGLRIAFPQLRQKIQSPVSATDKDRGRQRRTHRTTDDHLGTTVTDHGKGSVGKDTALTQHPLTLNNTTDTEQNEIRDQAKQCDNECDILPHTWLEFLSQQSRYLHHPIWDLCSPWEYYEWTEGWDWDQELGHRPTQAMANNDWENAPDMSAYPNLSLAQNMNHATREYPVTSGKKNTSKRTTVIAPSIPRTRPRPNQWSPSWSRTFSPIIIAGSPDLLPIIAEPPTLEDEQKEPEIDSEQDIELYYKAYSKYRPAVDESNAESRERSNLIYEEH
jgi:hypothetical protein